MNEKFHNSIKKSGEEISLTHEERARMRRTLHAYMEMKPLRAPASAPTMTFGWFLTLRPVAATLVLALFVSSAGISYAAEDALPGDVLYPVKTHVNEQVQGALALSGAAKTAWAMDVAGERVKEAATLAAEGRLSATTQQDLQTNFEQHARAATNAIEEDASSSPETGSETAVRFEAQLSEYENVLAQIGAAQNVDVASLTSSVKNEREHIADVRTQAESRGTSGDSDHAAATRMGIAARAHLDTSVRLAHAVSESLSSASAEMVAVQLDDASNTISAGEDFAARRSSDDAMGAFRSALTSTERLDVFLHTSSAVHARTGLIFGEPQKRASSKKGSQENGRGESGGGGGSQQPQSAATINTAATPAAATQLSGGSTTDTDEQKKSNEDNSSQKHGGGDQEDGGSDGHTLPVSVPVHLEL